MAKGDMRVEMPGVAALVDELRAAFGTEYINRIIQAGVRGAPVFHARENGKTVGTPVPNGVRVGCDAAGNRVLLDGVVESDRKFQETKFDARERREKMKGAR